MSAGNSGQHTEVVELGRLQLIVESREVLYMDSLGASRIFAIINAEN